MLDQLRTSAGTAGLLAFRAPDVMTDCLPGSILPDDLRKCGYGVTAAGDSLGYAVDPLALLNLRSTG